MSKTSNRVKQRFMVTSSYEVRRSSIVTSVGAAAVWLKSFV